MKYNKIFGIGLSKTGTSSLNSALGVLGFNAIHYPSIINLNITMLKYDAATDSSIACNFMELDIDFPNSKFIYTDRPFNTWLKSVKIEFNSPRHLEDWQKEVRIKLYGKVNWDSEYWTRAYYRHKLSVKTYFKNREQDILYLNFFNNEGWDKLCIFLDTPVPKIKFPDENKTNEKKLGY